RFTRMVGDDEDRCVKRRVIAPPAEPFLGPRPRAAAEHVAAHHVGADVRDRLLDHSRARARLPARPAVRAPPHIQSDRPLMELLTADAERVLEALLRAG